jgi:hypothetical protein
VLASGYEGGYCKARDTLSGFERGDINGFPIKLEECTERHDINLLLAPLAGAKSITVSGTAAGMIHCSEVVSYLYSNFSVKLNKSEVAYGWPRYKKGKLVEFTFIREKTFLSEGVQAD